MKENLNISLSFLFIAILIISSNFDKEIKTPIALAGSEHNLSGYAWSDTVGWVSFNCTDVGTCGTSNYGVNIDIGTGSFSGYAWSDNVGWISFNASDVSGCPAGACTPTLNSVTGEVTGWAKALSAGGGWDGFISLNCSNNGGCGTSNYSVAFSGTVSSGYAWGDSVVGWMSWCGTGYCVISSAIVSNELPTAIISSPLVTEFTTVDPILFNSVGSSDNDGTIVAYDWRDGGCGSGAILGTTANFERYLDQGTYPIYLRVQDDDGAWSICDTITINVGPPIAINGQCGGAHAVPISRAPSANLCGAGIPTTPIWNGINRWNWSCDGQYGGTNASCFATNSCGDLICQPGKFETPASCSSDCKANFEETL
ncbi:MAG: PKD domain-containing protein [Patescibacteria group bacterium]